MWNLWHGCRKKSEGCKNCYVYRTDSKYDRDPEKAVKTNQFFLPVAKDRFGKYRVPPGEMIYTCFTSDFLLEDCDGWREEAWEIIRKRRDCSFLFLTKRIERFESVMPGDWGEGWDHVVIGCTCENQKRADERLPIFLSLPIKHRILICEPMLGAIHASRYLDRIEQVIVGGESGSQARVCDYAWVQSLRGECLHAGTTFTFKQTGALFMKENKLYRVPRKLQHVQAKKAAIDFIGKTVAHTACSRREPVRWEQMKFGD